MCCIGNSRGGMQEPEFWQALQMILMHDEFENHYYILIFELFTFSVCIFPSVDTCPQQVLRLKLLMRQLQLTCSGGNSIPYCVLFLQNLLFFNF